MIIVNQDYMVNGECPESCGKCCNSILPLNQNEIKQISKYIKENKIKLINHNTVFTQKYVDVCPFLNEKQRCNIYPVRPDVCRTFNCNGEHKAYNHNGRHLVNLLMEFGDKDIFIPNDTPDVNTMDKHYQKSKQTVGIK